MHSFWPVWEVFDPRSGATTTIGFAQGAGYETAIRAVAELAGMHHRCLDAEPASLTRLDHLPAQLPCLARAV